MKLKFEDNSLQLNNDLVIHLLSEDFMKKSSGTGEIALAKKMFFTGKRQEIVAIMSPVQDNISIFYGLGREDKLNKIELEQIGFELYNKICDKKFKKITLLINGAAMDGGKIQEDYNSINGVDFDECVLAFLQGFMMATYKFTKYLTGERLSKTEKMLEEVVAIVKDKAKATEAENLQDIIRKNVFFCRDLVHEPSNELNPESYANLCQEFSSLGLEVEVLDEEKMSKLGMGALLSVGQGSAFSSQLVVLKYQGLKDFKDPVAFVGKGVTFDSGGISIKPSKGMNDMITDMAGSAVVASTLRLLAMRKAKINAVGVMPLVENMPSGTATRPGDIVSSMSGQTIEILDTDAEGRMILADALYYTVSTFNPKVVVDLATLTGAICVALGDNNAGLFTNSDELATELQAAAQETGENVWRMPLSELGGYYDRLMDSPNADVKNLSATRDAGAITAAQFLQRFINGHKKWAHLDIAHVANVDHQNFLVKKGITGYGVRLLNQLVAQYEK